MNNTLLSSSAFADTKPHYRLLDGLRGAAALMVVWYHIFEGFAFAGGTAIETFNHGYLAVDFFFMLSGFVISYAYDDRWNKKLTMANFFKRRLIRLHPMILFGALLGAVTFCIGGCAKWSGDVTPLGWVFVSMVLASLLIPAYPGAGYEVRGNGEMYPLNGPSWSLFFEYIGNLLYALFIRRLSNKVLTLLVAVQALLHAWFAIADVSTYQMIGVGWTLDTVNFFGGLLRMLFPFTLGMLLARNFKPVKIKGIFWIAIVLLFALFSVPFLGCTETVCFNGIFETLTVMLIFPAIVWLAASGDTTDRISTSVCKFLGDISYPLYVVHYPVMYLFYSWLIEKQLYTLSQTWYVALPVYLLCVGIAYLALKLYDEPIRKYLARRFIK